MMKSYTGIQISTFKQTTHLMVAGNGDSNLIINDDNGNQLWESSSKWEWIDVYCRAAFPITKCQTEPFANDQKVRSDSILNVLMIKNAIVLHNCHHRTPTERNKEGSITFPRSGNAKRDYFSFISYEPFIVEIKMFNEALNLCWKDGQLTIVKVSCDNCEKLPSHRSHRLIVDYVWYNFKDEQDNILWNIHEINNSASSELNLRARRVAWITQHLDGFPQESESVITNSMNTSSDATTTPTLVFIVVLSTLALAAYW